MQQQQLNNVDCQAKDAKDADDDDDVEWMVVVVVIHRFDLMRFKFNSSSS